MKNRLPLFRQNRTGQETATDLYLITLLGIFPLFPGLEGYANITFSKFLFFMTATGLWLAALLALQLRQRARFGRPTAAQWAALGFLAAVVLSWLCSPWRGQSLLAAGRYDGALTLAAYVLCFLGVSRFAVPKPCHAAALAAGTGLCCLVGLLQLLGLDLLRLFPGDLNYYDSGLRYSSAYLGTIGNTNILDAVLALDLPICAALWICGRGWAWLLPLLPCVPVLLRAGGSGVKLALAAAALLGAPLLLTDLPRVRRALRLGALVCALAVPALAFAPEYADGLLRLGFVFSTPSLLCALGGAALLLVSWIPDGGRSPKPRTLRTFFAVLSGCALLGAVALVWFWPGQEGAIWELHQVLHGQAEDSFGSSRLRIWRECLALVARRPLLGGGPGTLGLRLDIQFARSVAETGGTLRTYVDNAHNIYLAYLVNCGGLGLAGALALYALSFRAALRRGGIWGKALALGLAGALIHACFGLGLCLSEPLCWAALGLAAAGADGNTRKESDDEKLEAV